MSPLAEALGRVLAQRCLFQTLTFPAYDKTFIDGYAINPKDTAGASTAKPAVFKVVGKLFPADYPTNAKVASGEAIYVACGAPIPKGAASTVKVEETRLNGDKIEVVREIKARRRHYTARRRRKTRHINPQARASSATTRHRIARINWVG